MSPLEVDKQDEARGWSRRRVELVAIHKFRRQDELDDRFWKQENWLAPPEFMSEMSSDHRPWKQKSWRQPSRV